jgi:predicted SnoaL-like aldol condensation-catalyzing enzyme
MSVVFSGAKRSAQEERNRKAALEFYESVIIRGEYDRILEWVDPEYIQHKPGLPNGPNGVIEFMRAERQRNPEHTVEIVRCFVDGDYVFLHVHVHLQPAEADRAVMDILRCKHGKLVEHWDVDQPVPESLGHSNGMF